MINYNVEISESAFSDHKTYLHFVFSLFKFFLAYEVVFENAFAEGPLVVL